MTIIKLNYFILFFLITLFSNLLPLFINPIYSILCLLIIVLLLILILFLANIYYIALTFLIIYAGAIIILFISVTLCIQWI